MMAQQGEVERTPRTGSWTLWLGLHHVSTAAGVLAADISESAQAALEEFQGILEELGEE